MEIPLYECFDFSAIRVNKRVEVNFACVMRSRVLSFLIRVAVNCTFFLEKR